MANLENLFGDVQGTFTEEQKGAVLMVVRLFSLNNNNSIEHIKFLSFIANFLESDLSNPFYNSAMFMSVDNITLILSRMNMKQKEWLINTMASLCDLSGNDSDISTMEGISNSIGIEYNQYINIISKYN